MRIATGNKFRNLCLSTALLLCSLLSPCFNIVEAAELPRVFIVHSYDLDNFTSSPQDCGLTQGLADHGFVDGDTVVIERFYMDTKRTYTSPEQIEARGTEALTRIKAFRPDLVITVDDNAARTVMLPLVDSGIPVVFSGINNKLELYNQRREFMRSRSRPGHNVTGVHEKLYIGKQLQVAAEIIPNLKKVVFIVDDSPTGNGIKKQMEDELFADNSGILYTIRQVGSFDEYKQLIRWIDADPEIGAYCPVATRLTVGDGSMITVRDIMHWTLGHVRKPALTFSYLMAELGTIGGLSVDFTAMGRQAGNKGALILKGQPAGKIGIEDAAKYGLVFNVARARQLGVVIPAEMLGAADNVYKTMELAVVPKPFHILIVHSNKKGIGAGADIEKGLLAELGRSGFIEGDNLKICRFYMETRRTYITPEQVHQRGEEALEEVEEVDPDLVITLEDAAAKEVMLPLVDSSYPVLFGGIRIPPEKYNDIRMFMSSRSRPGHNVSGVTGEYRYEKTRVVAQMVFPEASNIILINSGTSSWLDIMNKVLNEQAASRDGKSDFASVRIASASTLKEFKRLVLEYNTDPNVDLISAVSPVGLIREDGIVSPLAETLSWLFANQKKPGFAYSDSSVRYGHLMAAAIDLEATGRQLGQLAIRVLRGADPADLSIQSPADSYIVLNLARARQLGVEFPVDILESAHKIYHTMEPEKAH